MEKAKVYWADFRTTNSESLMQKLVRLVKNASIETIDFDGKFTAIKLHFGEPETSRTCGRIMRERFRNLLKVSEEDLF